MPHKLLIEGYLVEFLEFMYANHKDNDALLNLSKINGLNRDFNNSVISQDFYDLQRNRIIKSCWEIYKNYQSQVVPEPTPKDDLITQKIAFLEQELLLAYDSDKKFVIKKEIEELKQQRNE